MQRKYFYFILTVTGIFLLIIIFSLLYKTFEEQQQFVEPIHPPQSPFPTMINGLGVVEPKSEIINIGTSLNRTVKKVYVKPGEKVTKGEILLELDNGDLLTDKQIRELAYKKAQAQLKKLESLPQKEDLEEAQAAFEKAKAGLQQAQKQYDMVNQLPDPRALSQEEKDRRLFNFQQAEADLKEAQAKLDKIKAGAWKPDLEIAQHEIDEAKAQVKAIETELARTVIKSPLDATVLQVNIHEGELASPETSTKGMVVLGDIDELYLRVSIDQLNARYFHPNERAVAFRRGDAHEEFPLKFIRVEPMLTAKKNLTNAASEQVDTQVFKIIYQINKVNPGLYVGELMDVFIQNKKD